MNPIPVMTIEEPKRRAHCTFCGGKGADLQAETVVSPNGTTYRVPLSHASCKRSVLEGAMLLAQLPEAQGVTHANQPTGSVRPAARRARRRRNERPAAADLQPAA